mmetsp:Transcript_56312/g.149680  ORF Transcript_56312/g.149680 Transcript_56312/m.149680 type:complete len:92 (-) Transcript_56312:1760-2035(-)
MAGAGEGKGQAKGKVASSVVQFQRHTEATINPQQNTKFGANSCGLCKRVGAVLNVDQRHRRAAFDQKRNLARRSEWAHNIVTENIEQLRDG